MDINQNNSSKYNKNANIFYLKPIKIILTNKKITNLSLIMLLFLKIYENNSERNSADLILKLR